MIILPTMRGLLPAGKTGGIPSGLTPFTWYDSADAATMFSNTAGKIPITDTGRVARWNSKGNGPQTSLQQTADVDRPYYDDSYVGAMGARPGVYFNAASTETLNDTSSSTQKGGFIQSNKTTFCVFFHSAVTGFRVPHWFGRPFADTTSDGRRWGFQSINGYIGLMRWNPTYDIVAARTSGIYLVTIDTNVSATRCWVGGTLIGTKGGYLTYQAVEPIQTQMGSCIGGGWHDGIIREYIHFEQQLSDADRNSINLYLTNKWGL